MKKKFLSFLIILCMILAMSVPAYAANNGPSDGENAASYILLYSPDFSSQNFIYAHKNKGVETSNVKGVTYDKNSNTLTLNNYRDGNMILDCNEMGEDFKIKLSGSNELNFLCVWGYGYGGSLNIKGTGKLVINKNKNMLGAVKLLPEGCDAKLVIGNNVNMELYNDEDVADGTIVIEGTTSSKALTIQGKKACEPFTSWEQGGTKYYFYTYSGKTIKGTRDSVIVGKPNLSSVTAGTGKFSAKWTKNSYADGYELRYSTSSKFPSNSTKKVIITSKDTLSKTVSKLTKGKTYYVSVRAYKTVGATKFYSGWTSAKNVKIK